MERLRSQFAAAPTHPRLPSVVIVGRPNVGKSSIFNWLVGKRIAIVDPTSGVTRDRVGSIAEAEGRRFELVDTGGMGVLDRDGLTADIERQIDVAIREATIILFVVDAHDGVTALDELVDQKLRRLDKPIVCVANKCDSAKYRNLAASEFHRFGRPLVLVSVEHRFQREELLEAILERLPPDSAEPTARPVMKLAVVGKRNVGKSTFINSLAGSERMIVSEVPGTTRDSVDVHFDHNGKEFVAIDTAGVRRKSSLQDSIEFYSYVRAQGTIRRADVVLFLLDARSEVGKIDKQLGNTIVDEHKPCVIVVNKWDLAEGISTEEYDEYLSKVFPGLEFAPRAFITAKTGRNVLPLVDLAIHLYKQAQMRVSTADLNRLFHDAMRRRSPSARQNKLPRIYYVSQVSVGPPTIVVFCNDPKLFTENYRRYLVRTCRENLPFAEVPIKLQFRRRDSSATRPSAERGADDADDEERAPVEDG